MSRVTLRGYQEQSVYLLNRAISAKRHPLCVLPTGSGKSLVIAGLLKLRDERAVVVSHQSELLKQDSRALKDLAPHMTQSFFAAKLKQKNAGGQVVFGSVQSIVRNMHRFKSHRRLLLIDEAHLCPRASRSMYAQVFDFFADAQRVGFSATPQRLDSGSLIEGEDAWFDMVAHEVSIKELIDQGFLLPLAGIITEAQADLDEVGMRGGEFIESEAQAAVMRTLSLGAAVAQACELAKRREAWLIFAVGIEHAKEIAEELSRRGISNEVIIAETEQASREHAFAKFRAGNLRALINVGVLTTGFDAPNLDCIISMRPTQSPILWQQMLGRGMRPSFGKKNCLLLDFVGNLERLGGAGCVTSISDRRLPEDLKLRDELRAKKAAPKRKQPEFFDASGRDPMVSGDTFKAEVTAMKYFTVPSRKQPGKRMLVASYALQDEFGRVFSARAFACVEYTGGARGLAVQWFGRRGVVPSQVPYDSQTALALATVSPEPVEVLVRHDTRMRQYVIEQERFALAG